MAKVYLKHAKSGNVRAFTNKQAKLFAQSKSWTQVDEQGKELKKSKQTKSAKSSE